MAEPSSSRFRFLKVFRPYWEWLCRAPVLLLEVLLLMGVVWGVFLADYGAPMLFWHEEPMQQFIAGVVTTWLLGMICYVGYLLTAEEPWMEKLPTLSPAWLTGLATRVTPKRM